MQVEVLQVKGVQLNSAVMKLHGNTIASVDGSQLTLNDCGWQTTTTKERLNGLLNEFNLSYRISQVKGQWYLLSTDNSFSRVLWSGKHTFDV